MSISVDSMFHYPIKGLSAQALNHVTLHAGQGFPLDRAFGFARPDSGFDPDNPAPLPKSKFMVLARDAALACLDTHYDDATQQLTIDLQGERRKFDVSLTDERQAAAKFLTEFLALDADQQPTLYAAEPHRFTDVSVVSPQLMNAVSLINLDSVEAFSTMIGEPVDPARFRGNICIRGADAFSELDWLDQEIAIGAARVKVVKRTKRCAATQVNLETGERDLDVPKLLHTHLGHFDMGVYAVVTQGGPIALGDTLVPAGSP